MVRLIIATPTVSDGVEWCRLRHVRPHNMNVGYLTINSPSQALRGLMQPYWVSVVPSGYRVPHRALREALDALAITHAVRLPWREATDLLRWGRDPYCDACNHHTHRCKGCQVPTDHFHVACRNCLA